MDHTKNLGWRSCISCKTQFKPTRKENRCEECRAFARQKKCRKCGLDYSDGTLKNTQRFCPICRAISTRAAVASPRLEERRRHHAKKGWGRIDRFETLAPFTTTWWGRVGELLFLHTHPGSRDCVAEFGNRAPYDAEHGTLGKVGVKTAKRKSSGRVWAFQVAGVRETCDHAFLIGFSEDQQRVEMAWCVRASVLPEKLRALGPESREYTWSEHEVSDVAPLNQKFWEILSAANSPRTEQKNPLYLGYDRILLGMVGEAIYKHLHPTAKHLSAENPLAPYDFLTEEGKRVNVRLRRKSSDRCRWTFHASAGEVDEYFFVGLDTSSKNVELVLKVPSGDMSVKGFSVSCGGGSRWDAYRIDWRPTSVLPFIEGSELVSAYRAIIEDADPWGGIGY